MNSDLRVERPRRGNLVIADWAAWSRYVPADQFMADLFPFGPDPTSSAGTLRARTPSPAPSRARMRQCAALLRP